MSNVIFAIALFLFAFVGASMQARADDKQVLAYFGTYTDGTKSKGIYCFRFDTRTGNLTPVGTTSGVENPSFLAVHPTSKYIYAVSESDFDVDGKPEGSVYAFSLNRSNGALKLINHQLSGGKGPCYVSIDHTGRCALIANYNNGSVASLPIRTDGSLGQAMSVIQHSGSSIDPVRQQGPHAHSINPFPNNRFAVAADLGIDKLIVYKLDPHKATLVINDTPFCRTDPGGGPRHLAFHPSRHFAYISNEMKSTVSAFDFDSTNGKFKEIQTISTLPDPFEGNSTAEIQVHPSGKFVYCSNRGQDSIAMFSIDNSSGKLSLIGFQPTQGRKPRNFTIDPSGKFMIVCNQASDNAVVFGIDPGDGKLTQVGQPVSIPAPVCVKFAD